MNNIYTKKNKYYYNYNNIYPINNKNNIYFCNKKIKLNNCIKNNLFEVENFLCNIHQISKLIKIINLFN